MSSSLNQAQLNQFNALNQSGFTYDDSPVAIRIKYKGTGSTHTVVVTPGTGIVLTSTENGAESFTFASAYATMGALVDGINGTSYWECRILDSLRSAVTLSKIVSTTVTADADGYYNVLTDTDALDQYAFRISTDREVGVSKAGGHRVKFVEAKYCISLTAGVANGFKIYEWDPVKNTETQVYGELSVTSTTTATTVNFASGNSTLDAKQGNELIVTVAGGAFTTAGTNYMTVSYRVE
jgi:hypothetical protein